MQEDVLALPETQIKKTTGTQRQVRSVCDKKNEQHSSVFSSHFLCTLAAWFHGSLEIQVSVQEFSRDPVCY